ncbi:MAG: hypothetical protein C6Y22_06190 [Hapalosiphonaceae cyanobacterium JJU2]|nr:MAG: hypothetical protein C6Y22_06190 [Hapalosiphonaceae cyanobacterium JJU2]
MVLGTKSKQLSKQNVIPLCSELEVASVVRDANQKKFLSICEVSLKLATSTAIFSMLAGFNAQPARADHLNFTLYNETSESIYFLYVSAARSNRWGPDILGRDVLRSGEYTRITFPNQNSNSPCIYDVKVVFEDRTNSVGRYNLCEIDSVTAR